MPIELSSLAEREAQKAESLPGFGGLSLVHLKRQIGELLKLIGRGHIFDEYTSHDIEHVDKMLNMLEWLIPDDTRPQMSPADWLLAVMGIYFHDVGMLVTRNEFERRTESDFPQFCDTFLFDGDVAEDYRHKVEVLPEPDRDRFLYQEFVRHHHAERIRWWVTGTACSQLGIAKKVASEIDDLLRPLGPQFRRDLGLIAESHHLNDLDDLEKYKTSQPYGDSDSETANLQYAAVLLRATDLLHMTADRTPSVVFRVIDPVDPLSQQEWAKQMAVRRVRSKVGTNEDGDLDPAAPRDTVEVHAYFEKEDGFFGLTAYLAYAAQQLAKCHDWISSTQRKGLAAHSFPWSKLDDSNIETKGFMRDAFQFTIDQKKILDLLTGHTLYNDSSVVLRELVQNSLDAIRLRLYEKPDSQPGEVHITWNSADRVLTVLDNGTGMTQRTISDHLLRVGASLYQDADFKEKHPSFSSISQFGIGVLSTFMIADNVEMITCHEDEESARRLALRSVHGKYLVRLLDKHSEPGATVAPHGTLFRLHIRQSVKVPDILKTARHWVVFPNCKVTFVIDEADPIDIGFEAPRDALVHYLRACGFKLAESTNVRPQSTDGHDLVSVVQKESGGVEVAYAVRWSPYFHSWSFLSADLSSRNDEPPPVGTCIEGIRVDTDSPGFKGTPFVAIANCRGENSPKTNVARSGLEAGPGRDHLLKEVYDAFCTHASDEITQLRDIGGHSLTWGVQEAQYLLSPLVHPGLLGGSESSRKGPVDRGLLGQSLRELPILLMESSGGREVFSSRQLLEEPVFWTLDCPLLKSAENLIRESPSDASIRSVMEALGCGVDLPEEKILCCSTQLSLIDSLAFDQREIGRIVLRRPERRLDLAWHHASDPTRWVSVPDGWMQFMEKILDQRVFRRRDYSRVNSVSFLRGEVEIEGADALMAFRYRYSTFWIGQNPALVYARQLLETEVAKGKCDERQPPVIGVILLLQDLFDNTTTSENLDQYITRLTSRIFSSFPLGSSTVDEWNEAMRADAFLSGVREGEWSVFNPLMWERRDMGMGEEW